MDFFGSDNEGPDLLEKPLPPHMKIVYKDDNFIEPKDQCLMPQNRMFINGVYTPHPAGGFFEQK